MNFEGNDSVVLSSRCASESKHEGTAGTWFPEFSRNTESEKVLILQTFTGYLEVSASANFVKLSILRTCQSINTKWLNILSN